MSPINRLRLSQCRRFVQLGSFEPHRSRPDLDELLLIKEIDERRAWEKAGRVIPQPVVVASFARRVRWVRGADGRLRKEALA